MLTGPSFFQYAKACAQGRIVTYDIKLVKSAIMQKTITILAFDQALASAVMGVADIFALCGVTWNRIQGQGIQPPFKVQIISPGGQSVRCNHGLILPVQMAMDDVQHTDVIMLPTIGGPIAEVLQNNPEIYPWLRHWHGRGADIASNCTGAFLLARSGLLDGRQATTHWGFADLFKRLFPQVNLQVAQLITADGHIFCAGGGMAWFDLALFLIERYAGLEIASETARAFVFDMGRANQSAYGRISSKKYHQDEHILQVQEYLEQHYANVRSLDEVALLFNLSPRTFKRRFKLATGISAQQYLQTLRIDAAKRLLESSHIPLQSLVQQLGYEDISSFSRLFKRETGLTPGAYRSRFGRVKTV